MLTLRAFIKLEKVMIKGWYPQIMGQIMSQISQPMNHLLYMTLMARLLQPWGWAFAIHKRLRYWPWSTWLRGLGRAEIFSIFCSENVFDGPARTLSQGEAWAFLAFLSRRGEAWAFLAFLSHSICVLTAKSSDFFLSARTSNLVPGRTQV